MATQVTLNSGSVDSAGSLLLKTNGTTTAVTIDTSQNVCIGTSTALTSGKISLQADLSTANAITMKDSGTTYGVSSYYTLYQNSAGSTVGGIGHTATTSLGINATTDLQFFTNATERARIDSSGNLQVSNLAGSGNRAVYSTSTGILTNSSSDRTLKTDDQTIAQGLDAVSAMRPVNFKWVDEERFGAQREIGFIAQEMQELVPEVVGTNHDGTLSIDYPKLTAVLVKAVQELSAKVAVLEAK